jgi:hypothetical protein
MNFKDYQIEATENVDDTFYCNFEEIMYQGSVRWGWSKENKWLKKEMETTTTKNIT